MAGRGEEAGRETSSGEEHPHHQHQHSHNIHNNIHNNTTTYTTPTTITKHKTVDFLRAAEALQLYCEVRGDAAFTHARWHAVGRELLRRPAFYWDRVSAALALTPDEQEDFLRRLGSRDLAADAEERTLVHLLLRADAASRRRVDWRRLKVEKLLPQHPPEGSLWRRVKILVPVEGNGPALPAIGGDGGGGEGGSGAGGGAGSGRAAGARASTTTSQTGSGSGGSTADGGSSGGSGRRPSSSSSSSSGAAAGAAEGACYREVKYW